MSSKATIQLRKIRCIKSEASGNFSEEYEAPSIEGGITTALVSREQLMPAKVHAALLGKGAFLPPLEQCLPALKAVIASPASIVIQAAQTGWRDGNSVFVCQHKTIQAASNLAVIPPENSNNPACAREPQGDLATWQASAKQAEHSTAMILALSAAFSAPLLALLNQSSFAMVLVGPSRSGKSTAQLMAASTSGFGSEEDLPTLNATTAGLLATALASNDHVLTINEIGTARGGKGDAYQKVREATYELISGKDVLRHPSFQGGAGARSFRTIVTMSSEVSPDEWARRANEKRDPGEMARLIGVPVPLSESGSVFDMPPPDLSGKACLEWERSTFAAIRQGIAANFGFALPAFIERLLRDRARLVILAEKSIRIFEKYVEAERTNPISRDIALKFGVLTAGGILAIKTGILPIPRKILKGSLRRLYRAAIQALPDDKVEKRKDFTFLKQKLVGGSIVNGDKLGSRTRTLMVQADGFYRSESGATRYIVRSESFVDWFESHQRAQRALETLYEAGFLKAGKGQTHGRSTTWAQTQVSWPDEKRVRSFVIDLPQGPNSLGTSTSL